MKKKYPWDSLKQIGDTFFVDGLADKIRLYAISAGKTRGWKIRVKKVAGGCIVRRDA